MPENQKFGIKLRELRTEAGLTLRGLADKVNVNFTYLSKIENGALPPPSEKVIRQLAETLNADKDELLALAGIIPSDIAEILKDLKTIERLRAERAKKEKKVAGVSKAMMSMPKVSIPLKGLYRLALPIFLVIAVAASLWYASPTKALDINIDRPASGTLGSTYTFSVNVSIEDNELLPLQRVDIIIYKSSDPGNYTATLYDLPKADSSASTHNPSEGTGSGTATVAADADANWDYWHGTGNVTWEGAGYTFNPTPSYGYGYTSGAIGATTITYTINWAPPSGWPAASDYKIEAKLTTSTQSPSGGTTFTKTSDVFTLSAAAAAEEEYPAAAGAAGAAEEEVTSGDIEGMETEEAADTLEAMDTDDAADLLEGVETETAAAIIEEVETETAAAIIEEVETETAAAIIEEVETETAAAIIEGVSTDKATAIMEELSTEKLNETIPSVEEDTLLATLPDLSVDKLLSLDVTTLFASLPSAPVAQISGEVPPEPPEGYRDAPVVVYVTETGEKAVAIKTPDGGWVTVIGTPAPIQQIMIKTNKALQDVSTTLQIHDQLPPEALVMLPDGQVVRSYITISFENASPEDIDLGHIAFYVEKEWLEQNSIHKWSVALHRYDPELNKWIALPTKRVAEDDDYIDYTAVITHFSAFAISGSEALPAVDFKTSNLVISPAEAESGEDITISVDVTNNADSAGTYVATLWVDSTVEAGKDVYVEAGKTESVSFTVTQPEGSYEVRIDRLIGSFSVGEAAPPVTPEEPVAPEAPTVTPEEPVVPEAPPVTPPEEEVTPPTVTPTNWWLIGGIIAAVIIILIAVWLLVIRRRD